MAFTHSVERRVTYRDLSYTWTDTASAGEEHNISESIPADSTDLELTWEADVSAMKGLCIVADGVVTIETNNGTTPDDTIVTVANEPIVWAEGDKLANPIGTDVTTNIFCTTGSGSAVQLEIRMVQDPTP